MRIVNVTLSGTPKEGDEILVHYCDPRGGRTTAGHTVTLVEEPIDAETFRRRPETLTEIVNWLVGSASMQFCKMREGIGAFGVKARGNILRIEVRDEVESVVFVTEVRSATNEPCKVTAEITEL